MVAAGKGLYHNISVIIASRVTLIRKWALAGIQDTILKARPRSLSVPIRRSAGPISRRMGNCLSPEPVPRQLCSPHPLLFLPTSKDLCSVSCTFTTRWNFQSSGDNVKWSPFFWTRANKLIITTWIAGSQPALGWWTQWLTHFWLPHSHPPPEHEEVMWPGSSRSCLPGPPAADTA